MPKLTSETDIPSRSISSLIVSNQVVSYYKYPNLYFIYHDRLYPIHISVGYTINFDTNYASYIKQIVTNNSLRGRGLEKSVVNTLDQIMRNDMDFTLFYYFIENFKLVNETLSEKRENMTPESFWESLNIKFRDNIVALHKFKEIDSKYYSETGKIRFQVDNEQAYKNSVDFTYSFYMGEGKNAADIFLELQRILLYSGHGGESGTDGGGVKSLDIIRNTEGEGGFLAVCRR